MKKGWFNRLGRGNEWKTGGKTMMALINAILIRFLKILNNNGAVDLPSADIAATTLAV